MIRKLKRRIHRWRRSRTPIGRFMLALEDVAEAYMNSIAQSLTPAAEAMKSLLEQLSTMPRITYKRARTKNRWRVFLGDEYIGQVSSTWVTTGKRGGTTKFWGCDHELGASDYMFTTREEAAEALIIRREEVG